MALRAPPETGIGSTLRPVRMVALVAVLLLTGCGSTVAAPPTPTPTPSPSPTPDVSALYSAASSQTHTYLDSDYKALSAAAPGSADEATAARHLGDDFQSFLDALDKIPFPPNSIADLGAMKKALVALQVFYSNVASDTSTYSNFTATGLLNDYNQAGILLGHDVGVSLVLANPSPTPS